MILGMAIRAATALGINLRNESSTPDSHKEIRYRVWWSLYILEHHLGGMTGRATAIFDEACTTPLPVPYDEDRFGTQDVLNLFGREMQKSTRNPIAWPPPSSAKGSTSSSDRSRSVSSSKPGSATPARNVTDMNWAASAPASASLFFLQYVQLARLTQDIMNLYNPQVTQSRWSQVQAKIAGLEKSLEHWYTHLPSVFDFKRERHQEYLEYRLSLGFFYHSSRIIVNRPCLCRLDRRIPKQSVPSRDFNRDAAVRCVNAALEMLALIPDEPNAVTLNSVGPWWKIVYYLMQAAIVMMLELSFRAAHMPSEAGNILETCKKTVRWLHELGKENPSAARAWHFCNAQLREIAPKIGQAVNDIPAHYPGRGGLTSQEIPGSTTGPTVNIAQMAIPSQPALVPSIPELAAFSVFDQFMPYAPPMGGGEWQTYGPGSAEMEFMSDVYHEQGE